MAATGGRLYVSEVRETLTASCRGRNIPQHILSYPTGNIGSTVSIYLLISRFKEIVGRLIRLYLRSCTSTLILR